MFGKVMKYELKSSMKFFLLVWAGLLAVALVGGIFVNSKASVLNDITIVPQSPIQSIMIVLYVVLAVAIVISSLIFIIQRFNKGLLGREGYLMFTLPVKTRTLIIGKCVSATLLVLLSVIAGLLSVILFFIPAIDSLGDLKEAFASIWSLVGYIDKLPLAVPIIIMMIVIGILSIIKFIYMVYTSISVGHLVGKHNMLMAVVVYIGLNIAEGSVSTAIVNIVQKNVSFFQTNWNAGFGDPETLVILGGVIAMVVIFIVIYHILTELILKNRLNLE